MAFQITLIFRTDSSTTRKLPVYVSTHKCICTHKRDEATTWKAASGMNASYLKSIEIKAVEFCMSREYVMTYHFIMTLRGPYRYTPFTPFIPFTHSPHSPNSPQSPHEPHEPHKPYPPQSLLALIVREMPLGMPWEQGLDLQNLTLQYRSYLLEKWP